MARIKLIQNKEDVSPEHYALYDELAALRGRLSGPTTVVMHSPRLAGPWNQISEYLHGPSVVEAHDAELAISATAREYDCPYIWAAHVPAARRAGVTENAIIAIRDRLDIDGLPPTEAAVVSYVRQLVGTNRIEDDAFYWLLKAHDPRWLVELTVFIGRYGALAGILNSFEVSPAGAEPLPLTPAASSHLPALARPPRPSPRISQITTPEQVDQANRPIFDAIAVGRGSVRGPYSILMYSPQLCRHIFDVSNCLQFDSELKPPLRGLATIATAREKDCSYLWAVHAPRAREEGTSEATISLVRQRGDAGPLSEPESDVLEYVRQVLRDHLVTQALFDRLLDEHGLTWLVELTCLIGHYGVLSSILNAFEIAPAPDVESLYNEFSRRQSR